MLMQMGAGQRITHQNAIMISHLQGRRVVFSMLDAFQGKHPLFVGKTAQPSIAIEEGAPGIGDPQHQRG